MNNGTPSYRKLCTSLNDNIEKSSQMRSSEESKRDRRAVTLYQNAIQNVFKFFVTKRT